MQSFIDSFLISFPLFLYLIIAMAFAAWIIKATTKTPPEPEIDILIKATQLAVYETEQRFPREHGKQKYNATESAILTIYSEYGMTIPSSDVIRSVIEATVREMNTRLTTDTETVGVARMEGQFQPLPLPPLRKGERQS